MESLLSYLFLYLGLGAVAGFLSGIFGIGGGLVIVPALLLAFPLVGIPEALVTHMAIGTSLATIIVTSLSSVRAHNKRGNVDWDLTRRFVPWIVLGSLVGGYVADGLPARWLEAIFATFMLLVAVQMWLSLRPNPDRRLPDSPGLALAGGAIGGLSAMLGIGGATLSVPFMRWCSVPIANAVGVAATLGFPIALSGTLSYLLHGWGHPQLPEWSLGYIYLPAFFGIVVASTQCVRFGASLAVRLPASVLQRAFAALLVVLGLRLLLN